MIAYLQQLPTDTLLWIIAGVSVVGGVCVFVALKKFFGW